jgi:FkbM family methyltransferase
MIDELASMEVRARELDRRKAAGGSANGASEPPLVLYGAGPLGQMTQSRLRHIGTTALAFVDSDPRRWGASIEGLPILAPEDAVQRYGASARFVVTIYNGSAVRRQLARAGVRNVSHFADLYFEHAADFLPFCGLAERPAVLDHWPEVLRASGVWHDQRSRAEFLAQLDWRLRLGGAPMPPHDGPAECYFPTDLFRYREDEVLFDCGAFDGDSLRQYLARSPAGGARRIIAFEPDAQSFGRLSAYVADLDPALAARVRLEPWAVAESTGEVRFSALGSVRSGVADDGGVRVHAVALDEIDVAPTLIKMDVEGFELPALRGAAGRLRENRPVLAISLYHHASDLWSIPNFLKGLVPEYTLHLRRYAEDCWELVLYAVPAARMLQS